MSTMEVGTLRSVDRTVLIGSLVEALVAEAFLAAGKTLACLLIAVILPRPLFLFFLGYLVRIFSQFISMVQQVLIIAPTCLFKSCIFTFVSWFTRSTSFPVLYGFWIFFVLCRLCWFFQVMIFPLCWV